MPCGARWARSTWRSTSTFKSPAKAPLAAQGDASRGMSVTGRRLARGAARRDDALVRRRPVIGRCRRSARPEHHPFSNQHTRHDMAACSCCILTQRAPPPYGRYLLPHMAGTSSSHGTFPIWQVPPLSHMAAPSPYGRYLPVDDPPSEKTASRPPPNGTAKHCHLTRT